MHPDSFTLYRPYDYYYPRLTRKWKPGEDKSQEVAQITFRACKGLNIGQCFQMASLSPSRIYFSTPVSIFPPKYRLLALIVEPSTQVHVRSVGLEEAGSHLVFWLEFCHQRLILPIVLKQVHSDLLEIEACG